MDPRPARNDQRVDASDGGDVLGDKGEPGCGLDGPRLEGRDPHAIGGHSSFLVGRCQDLGGTGHVDDLHAGEYKYNDNSIWQKTFVFWHGHAATDSIKCERKIFYASAFVNIDWNGSWN